jgi:hypothetical protein
MFQKVKILSGLAFAFLFQSVPVIAGEGRVDQVEGLEIERGAVELEFQSIFVPGVDEEDGEWKLAPTIEYGVSDVLSIGLEFKFKKETGEALQWSERAVQGKLALVSAEQALLGLGVQSSMVFDRSGAVGFETYFIAEHRHNKADFVANLVLATGPGDWSEISTSYIGRFNHAIGDSFALGLESGGELSGDARGRHWVGPVLSIASGEGSLIPAFELAVLAPLTRETPDVQFRLEFDWEF